MIAKMIRKALLVLAAAGLVCSVSCSKQDPAAEMFTITFDADGGEPEPEPLKVKKGEYAVEPESPVKDGSEFLGWYTGFGFKFNFASTPITKDMTLTARYWDGPKKYILINDYCYRYDEKAVVNYFGTPYGKETCAGFSMLMFMFGRSDDANAEHLKANLEAAKKYDCPILCNFDPITFWDGAPELWNWFDPNVSGYKDSNRENVEWYNWGSANAVKCGWLNWGAQCRLKPMANLFSPEYQAAVEQRLNRYLKIVKDWYDALPNNKKYLLVGVKVVGELALGVNNWYYTNGNYYQETWPNDTSHDPTTGINMYIMPSRGVQTIGYAAATYAGIKRSGTLTGDDIFAIEAQYSAWLASLATKAGFSRDLVFTHAGGMGGDLNSTINPDSCPSWSFYLGDAYDATQFKDAMRLIQTSTAPYWAESEWAIGADEASEKWASGLKSGLDIEGCRYINICTNVIGNNNGTTVNQKAVDGIRTLLK